jgi:flavin-dependent dehydrogenase
MFDVIIVGGGITGAYLAGRLGLDVLLIEKNREIVTKDSGIVSKDFLDFFDKKLIKKPITRMDVFSPSGFTFTLHSPEPYAYILKRELFSKYLISKAKKNAKIIYGTVTNVKYEKDRVIVQTTSGTFEGKLIVGADGANSIVRKAAGIESPRLSVGLMVKTKNLQGNINVFLNKYFSPDFFSWIIPHNDEYGLITGIRPREYLNYFKRKLYLPDGKIHAHLIPTGYTKSYANRTLLVGDAAGQNKPLTGGGIMFGLRAARCAEIAIRDAFELGSVDKNHLWPYEMMWKKDFAWEIDKQFLVRMLYRRLTNRQIDKLFLDIGPEISRMTEFDYDKISSSIKIPKMKMLRAIKTVFF